MEMKVKSKGFKLSNIAVDNKTTIFIFTAVLTIFGIMQYLSTPKEQFPDIVFPYFMINTIHPGTSPADMENLITSPIEQELKGIEGMKTISSKSLQDFSLIVAEFDVNANETQAYLDVKQSIDDVRSKLPSDIFQEPQITRLNLSEQPILFINLSGDVGLVKLEKYAKDLQDEIESLEEISRVDIVGALEREIQINVDLYKMQAAGLSFIEIQNAIAMENLTISGGQVSTAGMKKNLRVIGEFERVDQIKDILLKDGIYLKNIAEINDGFKDRESYSRLNGYDIVTLSAIKKSGQNLIDTVDKINPIIEDFVSNASQNLQITTTGDSSVMTRNSVNDLFNTIIFGVIVVVFVLMFFMGTTDAIFVGLSIPLSMLIAFILIPILGFTLNMVVLMAFIMVLGIVVDNSIVIIENIHRVFNTTKDLPILPATKQAVGEVAIPVFTGTITTMAPFLPLIFMPGIMGKFISYLPITIIVTLAASLLVAYIINPVFAVSFMKTNHENNKTLKKPATKRKPFLKYGILLLVTIILYLLKLILLANIILFSVLIYLIVKYVLNNLINKFQNIVLPAMMNSYRKTLTFLLKGKRPYAVIASTVVLLFLSFIMLGITTPKIVFMPSSDPSVINIFVAMPEGTHIAVTDSITKNVEDRVFQALGHDNPNVESIVSSVAVNAGRDVFESSTQEKLAKVTITFVETKYRTGDKSTVVYLDEIRENMKGIAGAEIEVARNEMGPPAGKAINMEISGDDIEVLVEISERLKMFIEDEKIDGIEDLQSNMEINKPELALIVDREKASKLGISTARIGSTMRTAIYGSEISRFREGEDEYPIQLRLDKQYRDNIDILLSQTFSVPSGNGQQPNDIPLSSFSRVEHTSAYGGITRIDNERVITLSSNVLTGYNANEIIQKIKRALNKFDLPKNYSISFTGEQDMQNEIGNYLVKALFIAVSLILIILVAQFNSFAKPLIITSQILFSFIGILLGFMIFGMDISIMMTGMGIIAVAGVVVKNAIILIDYTDLIIDDAKDKIEGIVNAGATRLTPVLLTAMSTILGLMPLAFGMNINFVTLFTELNPDIYFGGDNAAFWNPLAWTIIFGLAFATFLTLVVVPTMYRILYVKEVD